MGRRDHALLLTMYNSGARVSEITSLKREQVVFGATTFLALHGKGRKDRTIPLWPQTRDVLKRWFRELGEHKREMAFPNARGRPLARHSVNYLIHKAVEGAAPSCPSLLTRPITPHLLRHNPAYLLMWSQEPCSASRFFIFSHLHLTWRLITPHYSGHCWCLSPRVERGQTGHHDVVLRSAATVVRAYGA
jgi:integrase